MSDPKDSLASDGENRRGWCRVWKSFKDLFAPGAPCEPIAEVPSSDPQEPLPEDPPKKRGRPPEERKPVVTDEGEAKVLVQKGMPEALKKYTWRPGQSGNPGGNAPRSKELKEAFKSFSYVALNVLLDLLTCDHPATRFRSAEAILIRGYGRQEKGLPEEGDAPQEERAGVTYDWNRLNNDEWTALKRVRTELKAFLAKAAVPAAEVVEGA